MRRARLTAATLLAVLAFAHPGAAAPPCAEHEIGAPPRALGTDASTAALSRLPRP
jgi:hypothetical protein